VDSVHGWWTTTGSHDPPWIGGGADRRAPGSGGTLVRSGPPAAPEHGNLPAGAEKGEGSTGVPSRASPRLRLRCGGRATVMKRRRMRCSVAIVLKFGEREKEGMGAVRTGGVASFYRAVRR
jgi:hypothetical protein